MFTGSVVFWLFGLGALHKGSSWSRRILTHAFIVNTIIVCTFGNQEAIGSNDFQLNRHIRLVVCRLALLCRNSASLVFPTRLTARRWASSTPSRRTDDGGLVGLQLRRLWSLDAIPLNGLAVDTSVPRLVLPRTRYASMVQCV